MAAYRDPLPGEASRFDQMIACRDHVLKALYEEMAHRRDHDDWVERERAAVANAASAWAERAGFRQVTVEDVERIETSADGHPDYAKKLALYVAEFVLRRRA